MSAPPLIRQSPASSARPRMKLGLQIPDSPRFVGGPLATQRSGSGSGLSINTNVGNLSNSSSSSSLRPETASTNNGPFSAEILAAVGRNDSSSSNLPAGPESTSLSSIQEQVPYASSSTIHSGDGNPVISAPGLFTSNSGSSGSEQYSNTNSNGSSLRKLDVEDLDGDGWTQVAQNNDIVELGRLGEGAGGSVTRCKLKHGKTVFALKEIITYSSPDLQKQILRELQFNRSCQSPHIVRYYGTFLSHESAAIFIAMEYCGGGSLDAIYKHIKQRGGRIGEKVMGKIAEGVLQGLSYLHERRIIHRDIKPQNILLDNNGQVKLCDFGVSGEVVDSLATTFTGTSYYMAPERIQGQPYTVTSDVWSLGLTLMEVAQQKFPFLAEGHNPLMPIELLTFIVNMPPPELSDEPEEGIKWTESFRHFLRCCLEKDNKRRPSPRQMMSHPWLVGQSQKKVRMDRFVQECWS